jgi:hypothetical protein
MLKMVKEKLNHIFIICFISLFLLIASSPILSLFWLVLPTGYFLYNRKYKNILKIWGFTICIWYFLFTASLPGITILIGFEHTKVIVDYMHNNIDSVMFETLCFQTVYILDFLSAKLGFPLYVPSIINIFSAFLNLFKNDKPKCSGKDESNASSPWWGKSSKKSKGEKSLEECKILEKNLRKSESIIPSFYKWKSTTDGKTTTTYSETRFPFIGHIINCTSRNATELEKKVYKANKKNKTE